jgi:hypothetical protein
MKRFGIALIIGCLSASAQQATQPTATATAPAAPPPSSVQETNDRYVKQITAAIAGEEKEPASSVFKNVRLPNLMNVPAGQFLVIMSFGYSKALGVTCTHCHNDSDFSSDEKRPKRAAREMAVMHHMINEQLSKMENLDLKTEDRYINCTTCHHGVVNPRNAK